MQDTASLYFEGLEQPVVFSGSTQLLEYFTALFPNADYKTADTHDNPVITVKFDGESYELSNADPADCQRYSDKADAVCDLIAKLAVARSLTDPDMLYLHAAAVVINGRAVIFPSHYRAGKSFLSTCLVASGHTYIGDDVIPLELDSCKVKTAGFAPRLRLPLPGTTDEKTRNFIDRHMTLQGKRYAYLDIEAGSRLARDEPVNIGAFVLLERQQGVQAQLEELPVASVFQQLVKQNFAREVDASRILATLSQAVSSAQCVKLRYDRADDAVSLLSQHFSNWPKLQKIAEFDLEQASSFTYSNHDSRSDCFRRNSDVQKLSIEGETFLASADGKAIYHLNPVASGIWELLAEPVSKEDITGTLAMAFPEMDKAAIENDVDNILNRLGYKGLILQQA